MTLPLRGRIQAPRTSMARWSNSCEPASTRRTGCSPHLANRPGEDRPFSLHYSGNRRATTSHRAVPDGRGFARPDSALNPRYGQISHQSTHSRGTIIRLNARDLGDGPISFPVVEFVIARREFITAHEPSGLGSSSMSETWSMCSTASRRRITLLSSLSVHSVPSKRHRCSSRQYANTWNRSLPRRYHSSGARSFPQAVRPPSPRRQQTASQLRGLRQA